MWDVKKKQNTDRSEGIKLKLAIQLAEHYLYIALKTFLQDINYII